MTETPPVAIISAALAERYFPNQDPIGRKWEVRVAGPTPDSDV